MSTNPLLLREMALELQRDYRPEGRVDPLGEELESSSENGHRFQSVLK